MGQPFFYMATRLNIHGYPDEFAANFLYDSCKILKQRWIRFVMEAYMEQTATKVPKTSFIDAQPRRISYVRAAPDGWQAILALEHYVNQCGLEPSLLDLVRTRVSQMNNCAFCIDIHTKDARARGESEQRLYGLTAWWETPYYSDRERAALAWAEAVTKISEGVPDELYEQARLYFSEKELVDLTLAVIAINGTTRISAAFQAPAGAYRRDSPVTLRKESEPLAK